MGESVPAVALEADRLRHQPQVHAGQDLGGATLLHQRQLVLPRGTEHGHQVEPQRAVLLGQVNQLLEGREGRSSVRIERERGGAQSGC